jgi:hypothetical protein
MELRFWMDPETGLPHILVHGVTEQEVWQVMSRRAEDFPGARGSTISLGQTTAGRYLQVVYVPDKVGDGAFVVTFSRWHPRRSERFGGGNGGKRNDRKKKQRYPASWDEERVRELAEHYDNESEDKQVAEHEAAFVAEGQTVMVVPSELVPEVLKLIGKKRPA